jgi:hypothetical protein
LLILNENLTHAQNSKSQKKENIAGTVVAQYFFEDCFYHPCYLTLIVRLEQDKKKQLSFVQVFVEFFPSARLPNDGFPIKLVDKARKWKFKAVRDTSKDAAMEEYARIIENRKDVGEKTTAWTLLPGAESEKLPIGEVLPFYFVESDDYKERK